MSSTVEVADNNSTTTVSITNNDSNTVTLNTKPEKKESNSRPSPKKPKKTTAPAAGKPSKKPKEKKDPKKKDYSTKPGHVEGKSWVWGDGKVTLFKFLQQGVMQKKPLPPGFYKACETSSSPSLKKLATIAKKFEIHELT